MVSRGRTSMTSSLTKSKKAPEKKMIPTANRYGIISPEENEKEEAHDEAVAGWNSQITVKHVPAKSQVLALGCAQAPGLLQKVSRRSVL